MQKEIKYLVGDTVTLVSERPSHWNNRGDMDKYLGTTVVIESLHTKENSFDFRVAEWNFKFTDIVENPIELYF